MPNKRWDNSSKYIGKQFNELTIISSAEPEAYRNQMTTMVICKCSCGTIKPIRLFRVKSGNTQSCGCLRSRDRISIIERTVGRVWANYKQGAKIRNLVFNITKEDIANLIFKPCFYCNAEGSNFNPASSKSLYYIIMASIE